MTVDWSQQTLGADISHYQRRPDFGKLQADGVRYVILKATQGMGVDPDFDWNRNEAARRDIPWLPYPFLATNDTTATMQHCVKTVGSSVPFALDWEAAGVPAELVEVWMDNCEADSGRAGLAYYGKWPPAAPTQRIERWPRWLPRYPKNLADGPGLPPWDGVSVVADWSATWMVWQYTGHGRLPGVAGDIDLNRLACPWEVFKEWYDSGQLPKPPPLAPVPTDVVLTLHSVGPAVKLLQQHLVARGFHVATDGDYGPQTARALAAFAKTAGVAVSDAVAALNR